MDLPALGSRGTLSKDDLFRALFCSLAVYKDPVAAEKFLNETLSSFPHLTFDKVDMSLDRSRDWQKFLVGYSGNDVFIAFKGTKSHDDIASDIMISSHSKFGGSIHRGFFDRSCKFVALDPLDFDPLPGLVQCEKRRIVFCGHSLGGAVAHMVLWRFLAESEELRSNDKFSDSPFSIAFGAPAFCNKKAASLINDDKNLRWRFINFVNQRDPVPLMLHRISRNVRVGLQGLDSFFEDDNVLQTMGGAIGQCYKGYEVGGVAGFGRSFAQEGGIFAKRATAKVVQKGAQISNACIAASTPSSSSSDVLKEPDFFPVGQYIFLVEGEDRWKVKKYFGDDHSIEEVLGQDPVFRNENREQHRIASYKKVLILIYGPSVDAVNISSKSQQSSHVQVRIPAPKVTFARWIIVDSHRQFIHVKGENLLFLREAVTRNGDEKWGIYSQMDRELWLSLRDSEVNISNTAPHNVVIKTAFGEAHQPILEDYSYNATEEGVSRMIFKIVQALCVKATPPLKQKPTARALNCLDNMMQCVHQVKEKKKRISMKLHELTECSKDINGTIENHCRDINYMLEEVVKDLRSSLRVEFFTSKALGNLKELAHSLLVESGLLRAGVIIGFMSLVVNPAYGVAVIVTCVGGALILKPSSVIFTEYHLVLKCAIEEASKWSGLEQTGANNDQIKEKSIFDLEKELFEEVDKSSSTFKKLVERAHEIDINEVPPFKSMAFLDATPQSKLKLLKRIKLVYDTIWLYNLEVAQLHFMGIFGAEDAGKSTFIKKVLEKFPSNAPPLMPETGFHTHTTNATTYKMGESLYLVDFPGSDGAGPYADQWKQLTALPSSSVLFLHFNNDVKMEQVELYREMKKSLGKQTNVAIVFNKVDEKFSSRNQDLFTTNYFEDLRERNEKELGCTGSGDRVYFACVDPDIELEDLNKLKAMGVLGFEELQNELFRRSIQSSTLTSLK